MGLEARLRRLETSFSSGTTPWCSLPPGVEPDWPRPLIHLSDEELQVISDRQIEVYCQAHEEGREHFSTPEKVYLYQEAFHELRWRLYGIARRSQGLARPEGWEPPV